MNSVHSETQRDTWRCGQDKQHKLQRQKATRHLSMRGLGAERGLGWSIMSAMRCAFQDTLGEGHQIDCKLADRDSCPLPRILSGQLAVLSSPVGGTSRRPARHSTCLQQASQGPLHLPQSPASLGARWEEPLPQVPACSPACPCIWLAEDRPDVSGSASQALDTSRIPTKPRWCFTALPGQS